MTDVGQPPQWTTSGRLLKLGETISFEFSALPDAKPGKLIIYPRYLESANPGRSFKAGGSLDWIKKLPSETISLDFANGKASVLYKPKSPGSYLATWKAGEEDFYRYFAVAEDDCIVLMFSTFWGLESEPSFHGTGIPLDYRLPIDHFKQDDPLLRKLLDYNRHYGELVTPSFPDMPDATHDKRVAFYGEGMRRVREFIPDPNDTRSIWVVMRHPADPGYPKAFREIGVDDHCGLQEANCRPWLGMPEFPYFASLTDCRKANQAKGGVVTHQWDFCGGFHFLGPVQWHYAASEGRIEGMKKCLTEGLDEFRNLTQMSGHPAFVTPLYDGVIAFPGYPNPMFTDGYGSEQMFRFVEAYQRMLAFEFTRSHKVIFARSVDMADYYRRHYTTTPRTVLVSKTDHQMYDAWWTQCALLNYGVLCTPAKIPWHTSLSMVRKMRETALTPPLQGVVPLKDPLSCEFVLIEDSKRSIRFERECPNPIWWFDYTREQPSPAGSLIEASVTPEVFIKRSQSYDEKTGLTVNLWMDTAGSFPGYAICLWGLPIDYNTDPKDISTDAAKYELVQNTDGEVHMVLYFDLKPGAGVKVVLRHPKAKSWEW